MDVHPRSEKPAWQLRCNEAALGSTTFIMDLTNKKYSAWVQGFVILVPTALPPLATSIKILSWNMIIVPVEPGEHER